MTFLIADHVIESTLFALLMGALTLGFTHNRAVVRYGLWFAGSLKFLAPFSLIVAVGDALRWDTAPVMALPWAVPVATSELGLPDLIADVAAPLAATPVAAEYIASGPDLESVLMTVWLGGMALLLCLWTLRWILLMVVRRTSLPSGITAPIPVRFSLTLLEPGLVGIFRPVLLLPEGIAAQLSPAQLALVIEHELCHWRRRDNLTGAIHMIVTLVFWFHPLVWWIGRRLVAERERACDESVLAAGGDPKAYAHSILEVCRFYVHSPLPCAPGIAGANLKDRVSRIMDNVTMTRLSPAKFALLATVAGTAVLLPMAWGLFTPEAAAAQPVTHVAPAPVTQTVEAPKPAPTIEPKAAPVIRVALPTPERGPAPRPVAAPAPKATATPRPETVAAANAAPAPAPKPAEAPKVASPAPVPPAAPMDEIVVTAKTIRDFVRTRNFVRLYTAPSDFLDQISRWHAPLCVHTEGLAKGYNAFVTARVKEVATQIGAPKADSDNCKTNLSIIFNTEPQKLLDVIGEKRPDLLGPHYPALRKKLTTMNHPVQAWYATGTRDARGRLERDSYEGWDTVPGADGIDAPVYYTLGSRLRSGLTSEFASVVIVADIPKIEAWEIGTIADYIAMMALARAKTPDKCQQVPSITNVLEDCSDGVRAKSMSEFDLAYLKALYTTAGDAPRGLQESGISRAMIKILEKQIAGK